MKTNMIFNQHTSITKLFQALGIIAISTFFSVQTMKRSIEQVDPIIQIVAAGEQGAQPINIRQSVAQLSITLKNMIEDLGTSEDPIPVHNVSHTTLQRVVQYLNLIHNNDTVEINSNINALDPSGLFDILQAANYLDIEQLRSLSAQRWGKLCNDNFDDFKKNNTYKINKVFTLSKQLPLELNQLCARYIPSAGSTQSFFANMLSISAKILSGHTESVNSVCFSTDGKTLASGSDDGTIKLWNVTDGSRVKTLYEEGSLYSVYSVCFSPDGKTLASGSGEGTIKLWNIADGSLIKTLSGHEHYVTSVCFSPDGRTLASGSWDNAVKLWNIADGSNTQTLSGHEGNVNSVCFSPDGTTLASGSDDGTIKLWNVTDGSCVKTLYEEGSLYSVYSVCFSPDGKTLASGSGDNTIKLWNVADGSLIKTLSGHTINVNSVCFSPDGKTLASGSEDENIKLWNVADGSLITTLCDYTDTVYSLCFSPDGKTLASGSDSSPGQEPQIMLWDLGTLDFFLNAFNQLTIEQVLFLRLIKEAAEDKKTIDLSLPEHAHLAEIYSGLPEEIQKLVRAYLVGVEA